MDLKKAYHWYKLAADQGNEDAKQSVIRIEPFLKE